MESQNLTDALTILAMLRRDLEEAQRILADETLDFPQRAKIQQTIAGFHTTTDALDRLLSEALR